LQSSAIHEFGYLFQTDQIITSRNTANITEGNQIAPKPSGMVMPIPAPFYSFRQCRIWKTLEKIIAGVAVKTEFPSD
jgi:hypothetical protein